jgi:1-acyl-sn-glycerol-3-phosphate acyltransferase
MALHQRQWTWLPSSNCTVHCINDEPKLIGTAHRYARIAGLLGVTLLGLALVPYLALPLPGRGPVAQWFVRLFLRALGIRLAVTGMMPKRGLAVSNHASWLDSVVLIAVAPMRAVAKAEVRHWPGIGFLVAKARTIFITRQALSELPAVVDQVRAALTEGGIVHVHAEGTMSCGGQMRFFKPAFFQAAVDADVPVIPLAVTYKMADGSPTRRAYLGDESIATSFLRVLNLKGLTVTAQVRPQISVQDKGIRARKVLARHAQTSVEVALYGRLSTSLPISELVAEGAKVH